MAERLEAVRAARARMLGVGGRRDREHARGERRCTRAMAMPGGHGEREGGGRGARGAARAAVNRAVNTYLGSHDGRVMF